MNYAEQKSKWLASLKPGDEVAVTGTAISGSARLEKIDRMTATQIIIGSARYSKKDGCAIGQYSEFRRPYISEITDSVRNDIELRELRYWANSRNWNALTLDQLRAIKAAYDESKGKS